MDGERFGVCLSHLNRWNFGGRSPSGLSGRPGNSPLTPSSVTFDGLGGSGEFFTFKTGPKDTQGAGRGSAPPWEIREQTPMETFVGTRKRGRALGAASVDLARWPKINQA